MRKVIGLLLAGAAVAAPASAAERGFAVAGFDRIRAAGPFDVVVRVGGPVSVRASGPQAALDRLLVTSEGGQLVIRPDRSSWSVDGRTVIVTVTTPSLRGVSLAGSGNVTVDRARASSFAASLAGSGDLTVQEVTAENVAMDIAGSGDLTLSGRARIAKASVAGSGDMRAAGLSVADATVSVAGSGDVALEASGRATVSLVGSGDVTITGKARCTVSRRGSGEVRCAG